jgi:hypothetical protein
VASRECQEWNPSAKMVRILGFDIAPSINSSPDSDR